MQRLRQIFGNDKLCQEGLLFHCPCPLLVLATDTQRIPHFLQSLVVAKIVEIFSLVLHEVLGFGGIFCHCSCHEPSNSHVYVVALCNNLQANFKNFVQVAVIQEVTQQVDNAVASNERSAVTCHLAKQLEVAHVLFDVFDNATVANSPVFQSACQLPKQRLFLAKRQLCTANNHCNNHVYFKKLMCGKLQNLANCERFGKFAQERHGATDCWHTAVDNFCIELVVGRVGILLQVLHQLQVFHVILSFIYIYVKNNIKKV